LWKSALKILGAKLQKPRSDDIIAMRSYLCEEHKAIRSKQPVRRSQFNISRVAVRFYSRFFNDFSRSDKKKKREKPTQGLLPNF
jgi:hypothetical protein